MGIKKVALYFAFGFLSVNSFAQNEIQAVRSELYFTDPEKLPTYINSEAEEIFLLFSRDSSTLYFVRANHPENEGFKKNPDDQDIWYTRKDKSGNYEMAKDLHQFNNEMNNGVVGMSLDGNTIYLLDVYNKRGDKGICVSHRKGTTWSKPEKLDIPGLKISADDLWGFYVNPQETVMILSYKGSDSMGEEDLYVILKEPDSKGITHWGKPKSLGPKINSTGYEFSPYLSEDGYTLFWSTNGRGGEGNADIFASFRTDEGWVNWSEPVNMGPKINSKGFDAYFIINANDAWWASDRDGGVQSDIYHARAVEPEPVTDTIVQDTVVPVIAEINPKEIPRLPAYIEVKLFFAKNSSMLEPEAKHVADSVIAIMKARPEVVAEIHSHADKRASDEYNKWLTQRRATRVVDYMVLMGISKSRLTANWYGKTKLAVECDPCTEEQHRESRRTVIKLSRIE